MAAYVAKNRFTCKCCDGKFFISTHKFMIHIPNKHIIHSGENPNNYNHHLLSGVKKVVKTITLCKEHILVTKHTVNTMQASIHSPAIH